MACFVSTLTYVLCRTVQHYCWPLRAMRTSAPGTSRPLPTCRGCSEMPRPLTRTSGLLGPPALAGTQSPKGRKNTVLRLQIVESLLGRELVAN
eukprot:153989-Amphidinium_carterae.1